MSGIFVPGADAVSGFASFLYCVVAFAFGICLGRTIALGIRYAFTLFFRKGDS